MNTALAFAALFCAQAAFATPSRVILIRHGEKPDQGDESSELSERGKQRAEALVGYFERLGAPNVIFAMQPKGPDGSVRAIQTVQPLADALGLSIDADYKKNQVSELAAAVLAVPDGKTALICWEHTVIPDILGALGWADGPTRWRGSVYDRTWILDFKDGKPASFTDEPQHLLPGDSDK